MKKPFSMRKISIYSSAVVFSLVIFIILYYTFGFDKKNSNIATKVYFADNISPTHQAIIDRFNDVYKNQIRVIPIDLPFTKFSTNERKELLARSLRGRSDLIDIFAVDLIWVPRFAKWAEPLDFYIRKKERDQLLKYVLESCNYNDRFVAAPFYIDIGLMYYRRDILQSLSNYPELAQKLKESITWEELIGLRDKFEKKNNHFYIFPAKNYEGLICSFFELIYSKKDSLFSADSIRLNTPRIRKGLQFLVDLIHKYKTTPLDVVNFDEHQSYLYSLQNDAVFLRGWPGFLRHYYHLVEDTSKFKLFEIAALPHFRGTEPVSVFGGWNLMVSKHSKNKWAAIKFIQFASEKEIQKLLFETGGYIPINLDVYKDTTYLQQHKELAYYYKLLNRGIHRPYLEDYTRISDILSYYSHLAIKGEIPVETALNKATHMINSNKFVIK